MEREKGRCGMGGSGVLTFATATWKVYSVMRKGVLFENEASIAMELSPFSALLALKTIVTAVFETTISFEVGNDAAASSGRAEAKLQSSSAVVIGMSVVPLLCWVGAGVGVVGGLGEAKLKIEADGEGEGFCGGLEARTANGSEELGVGCDNEGPGVPDRDVGCELVREAKGS